MYKIIVNKEEEKNEIMILEEDNLVERFIEDKSTKRLEGNIYIGKVTSILKGMQAAFISIGENENAFIHIKEIQGSLKIGSPVLIQVKKDACFKKGAKLSTTISITGRYFILMPNSDFITTSQKIENQEEKNRLIEITKNTLQNGTGAIIRTSAEGKEEKMLINDLQNLIIKWEKIKNVKIDNVPKILYRNYNLLERIIIDYMDKKTEKIVVNNEDSIEKIKNILTDFNENIKIEMNEDIYKTYGLKTEIEKLNNRIIWLKSGGYITIDQTEALTAIDVNSGKYIGKDNLEKTSFEVNKEATVEIAKQLRLRDISGIIIVDYIDMHENENEDSIRELFKECIKKDRSKVQVEEFTKLHLLEVTRKKLY